MFWQIFIYSYLIILNYQTNNCKKVKISVILNLTFLKGEMLASVIVVSFKDSIEYHIIDSKIFYGNLPRIDICVSLIFSQV